MLVTITESTTESPTTGRTTDRMETTIARIATMILIPIITALTAIPQGLASIITMAAADTTIGIVTGTAIETEAGAIGTVIGTVTTIEMTDADAAGNWYR